MKAFANHDRTGTLGAVEPSSDISLRDRSGESLTVRASVIVVNYNGRDDLDRCLESVLASLAPNAEVIVVDNASTDGSASHIEARFPEVRVIRRQANDGFGAGCNRGAREARSAYLAFLNPDTVVEPGWLDALVGALAENPRAGLATSKILLLDQPEKVNAAGNDTHFTGLTLCRGLSEQRQGFGEPAEVGAVSGAAFATRRALFDALGGFDESFFLYMEDTDLSWRARLAGFSCVYVPSSIVYHRYTLRFGPRKTFYQERNRYLLLLKSLRGKTLVALLPGLVLAECVTWGFVLVKERRNLANKLHAYAWIIRHRREIQAARRDTTARRRRSDRDLIAGCGHRLEFEQTGAGVTASLAHYLLDPLFWAFHRLALAVIRW